MRLVSKRVILWRVYIESGQFFWCREDVIYYPEEVKLGGELVGVWLWLVIGLVVTFMLIFHSCLLSRFLLLLRM